MKTGYKIGIILVVGILLYIYFPVSCSNPAQDPVIDSLQRVNDSLKVQFTELLRQDSLKRLQDSIAHTKFEILHRQDSAKIAQLKSRPAVIQVRKEFPVIDTLILTYDTAVFRLQRRVAGLQVERVGDRQRFNMLLVNSEKRNINLQGINYSLRLSNSKLEADLKRQKRWGIVWKVTAGAAAAWRLSRR